MVRSTYLEKLFNKEAFKKTLFEAAKVARELQKDEATRFDAIAFTGNSGAIFAGALAVKINTNMILVRKPNESSHAGGAIVEGDDRDKRYLIVDDFISSGDTIKRIVREIKKVFPSKVCIGVLEYLRQSGEHFDKTRFRTPEQLGGTFGPLSREFVDTFMIDSSKTIVTELK